MSRDCHLSEAEIEAWAAVAATAEDVQLYVLLRWHRNGKTGEAFPGRSTLAVRIGINVRSVSYRLRRLETLGLIVTRATGRENRYGFPFATPATDCTSHLQPSDTGTCNGATPTPAMGLQPNSAEQKKNSGQADPIIEHARRIASWSGREIDTAALAALAEGVQYPSALRRAIDSLVSREPATVRAPLRLLPTLIAEEVARVEPF